MASYNDSDSEADDSWIELMRGSGSSTANVAIEEISLPGSKDVGNTDDGTQISSKQTIDYASIEARIAC